MGRYEPENTLQSFARSIDEQLDGIELDVWLTRDKIPVVIHSKVIDGVSGYITFDDGTESNNFSNEFGLNNLIRTSL